MNIQKQIENRFAFLKTLQQEDAELYSRYLKSDLDSLGFLTASEKDAIHRIANKVRYRGAAK